jgi:hypothetical protein
VRRLVATAIALTLALAGEAGAAGMTTHAWMAEAAGAYVRDDRLQALMQRERDALLSGAAYPDAGYAAGSFPGGDFGEVSHWERFVNAHVQTLRRRCAPVPAEACPKEVAHLLGAAAHGMGDELWDWLFEPAMHDHGESPEHPVAKQPGFAELFRATPAGLINTSEYVMDVVAIRDHGRLLWGLTPPPADGLLETYAALGRRDVTRQGLLAGHAIVSLALAAERSSIAADYDRVRTTMPWSTEHMDDASGGVRPAARAIAGYLDSVWRKLHEDAHPRPVVVGVHPEPDEEGVPAVWQPAQTAPGPRGGGAERRILATLSNAIDPATVTPESFRLLDAQGDPVPLLDGWPKPGPYGAGDGTHTFMLYPAGDLAPCSTYTAEVTPALRDHAGAKLARPHRWSFTTTGC